MIKLFSQSGIEPSDLSNNSNSKSIEQKLIDLRVVWESYLSMLPKGSNDVTSKTTKLIKKVQQGYFGGKTVCFVGFDDLSISMGRLFEAICASADSVYASVVEFDNQKTINSSVCDEFLAIAQKLNCSF